MRSTFSGLNTMVRGIFANQLAQDTTGHNITNAGTEGYSRQKVNQGATRAQLQNSIYGEVLVGTGVDSISLTRARNIYADKQFWAETSTQSYYSAMQTNFDKIEAAFDDSDDTGIQHAMEEFYSSWVDLSTSASTSANRVTVIEKGNIFADAIRTSAKQLQEQINAEYEDLRLNLTKFNDLTDKIKNLNQNIMTMESTGAAANDLRDERDLLVDQLSEYISVHVYESSNGMYTIVSNGISLVNGNTKLTLQLSEPVANDRYGLNDYSIEIKESGIVFQPVNGSFKGHMDAIAEDKGYFDDLSNMAAFLLTSFNAQHKKGVGIAADATTGINFFGASDTTGNTYSYAWDAANQCVTGGPDTLKGIQVINELEVTEKLRADGGAGYVAARADGNGTGDGSNAVLLSTLFNMTQSEIATYDNAAEAGAERSIGEISLSSYYTHAMARLGNDAQSVDTKSEAQDDVVAQIVNWRSSTSAVDWNEELSNMLVFQKGYSACARCLTTMDEMLDRLINNTGVVGR